MTKRESGGIIVIWLPNELVLGFATDQKHIVLRYIICADSGADGQ